MKKIIILLLMLTILLNICSTCIYANDECVDVYIDGELLKTDQSGIILNGRTLVPVRAICEALGCDVRWYGDSNEVQIWNKAMDVRLKINSYWMIKSYKSAVPDAVDWYVNNEYQGYYEEIELDVPPMIINGRTLIPARAISEVFYAKVNWNEEKRCVTIEKKYDEIHGFSEGLAAVKKHDKTGYIDMKGNITIPFEYDSVDMCFCNGVAVVEKNKKYGVIDRNGKCIVPFEYDYIGNFYQKDKFDAHKGSQKIEWIDGFARAKRDNKFGIIDVKGNVVIPFIYDVLLDFTTEGLAYAKMGDKYGYVDMKGYVTIPFVYDGVSLFYKGFSVVMKENRYGIIDKNGNEVLPTIFDSDGFLNFDNNIPCWITKKDNLWGILSFDGNILTPFEYSDFFAICDEFAFLCLEDKWGVFDINKGCVVVPFGYDGFYGIIEEFNEEGCKKKTLVLASRYKKYGVIDTTGGIVVPFEYEDFICNGYSSYIIAKKTGKWGVITADGNVMIPFEYTDFERIKEHNSYFEVIDGQQTLFYDKEKEYNTYER